MPTQQATHPASGNRLTEEADGTEHNKQNGALVRPARRSILAGLARYSTVQHGAALHSAALHGIPQHRHELGT